MKLDPNEPAFPGLAPMSLLLHGEPVPVVSGMSIRDWFAGHALAGINWNLWFENCQRALDTGDYGRQLAVCAYHIADAMLSERGKEPGT